MKNLSYLGADFVLSDEKYEFSNMNEWLQLGIAMTVSIYTTCQQWGVKNF